MSEPRRILVATTSTIPGYSGGWTTPVDLLQEDYEVHYLVTAGRSGRYVLEDVPVTAVPTWLRFRSDWPTLNRVRSTLSTLSFRMHLQACHRRLSPDLLVALDVPAAYACIRLGLPYVMRFHSEPEGFARETLARVVEEAIFATTTPSVSVPGAVEIPHNVDLDRFHYSEPKSADRAILVSTLNGIRCPMLFVEGVMRSSMSGAVVGTGPLADEVRRACEASGGKVEYLPPVPRLQLPGLLDRFQVGVATYRQVPEIYQMKVNGYLATGMMTVVMPWTHLALIRPDLTITAESPDELAGRLDWIRDNWEQTLEVRRKARDWVHANYSVDRPRRLFAELLRKHLGGDWGGR
jgi:hypothetical protein